jgi:hypothetical protein
MQKPIRDDGSIVCWLCASRLDPTLYRAFEKLGTSPLADLHSCQSPLWHDPELPKKLAAEGWRFLDADYREIALAEE